MKSIIFEYFSGIFDIRDGKEQEERIVENIKKGVEFRGANLWTLIFAVFIASIGLNINSVAVIVGAMLISPLMGPIVGLGLSLGINDSVLLKKALRSLSIATIIGVAISTLYFYLSPISNIQSELLARTSPTIYDVLIAFFGGLAGIVGSTRAERGNVIPGVAISTALMPPLCTAGYGIATAQPAFFFGALYLYAINCIFICLATFLGVEYLRLPNVEVDLEQKRKNKKIMTIVVVLMVIPATYLAAVFIRENNFNQNTERFIKETFTNKGHVIIYKSIQYGSNPNKIELAFLSKHFDSSEISTFKSRLADYGLHNTELVIKQDSASLSEEEWNAAISSIRDESEKVKALEEKFSRGLVGVEAAAQVLSEAQAISNKIVRLALGNLSSSGADTTSGSGPSDTGVVAVAIMYVSELAQPLSTREQETLSSWIKSRTKNQDLLVYFISQRN